MTVEIKQWYPGQTIKIINTYTDIDGNLVDPSEITLEIYTPDGTLNKTVEYPGDIVRSESGIYYYNYLIVADNGWYSNVWSAVINGGVDVAKDQFNVEDGNDKLYCTPDQVWSRCGMDSAVVSKEQTLDYILDAMDEIDSEYGRSFLPDQTQTQWFDTVQPDCLTVVSAVFLSHRPVMSVVSMKEYDENNNLVKTFTPDEYWVDLGTGRIKLSRTEFGHQAHRIEVVYISGYDKVPRTVSQLCAIMAGQNVLLNFAGSSYDDVTSYSAAGLSISVGEPYMNSTRTFELLEKQKNKLMARIGRLRNSVTIL